MSSSQFELSQQQRNKNIRKLIYQNKKLYHQVFTFQQQINKIISPLTSSAFQTPNQQQDHSLFEPLHQEISSQQQVIKELRSHLEYLKSTNIKQNIHYILQEEDELKIVKKELEKYRKEKKVVQGFVKDKLKKLKCKNSLLQQHRNNLKQELRNTIKFNREQAANIVELQREIRKYHYALENYKHLLSPKGKELSIQQLKNPQYFISQLDNNLTTIQKQIKNIQQKWSQQMSALDKEYFTLKQELQQTKKKAKLIQIDKNYHQNRVLPMKSQTDIQKDRQRKQKLISSPILKQKMEQYLKQEQQKLLRKQLYLQKQNSLRPKIQNIQQTKNPQKEKKISIENTKQDQDIMEAKNNLKNKLLKLEQTSTKGYNIEKKRLKRSWSSYYEYENDNNRNFVGAQKINLSNLFQKSKPKILLKNVKLGTTFYQENN